jgi:zinc protease
MVLTLHYGNEESLRGQVPAATMLPRLMMTGTKKHDRQALRDELEALGVQISAGAGGGPGRGRRGGGGGAAPVPGQLTFSVQAKRSTFPAALKLLGEILREPSFPADEFETLKRQARSMSERLRTEPAALASIKLTRALSPYSPNDVRYVPTPEENEKRLEALTLEQVTALYAKQLGATKGEIGIVGDFDPESAVAALRETLKDWKSDIPVRRITREAPADFVGVKEVILTPDKANAVFTAGMPFPLKDTDPEYAALRVGNFLFGGGTLSSRLGNRIRQKEGLSYGVTSQLSASSRDPVGKLLVNAEG